MDNTPDPLGLSISEKKMAYTLGFLAACAIIEGQDVHSGWRTTLNDRKAYLIRQVFPDDIFPDEK